MDDQAYDDEISRRYGFELPESYRQMRAAGLFDVRGPQELWLTDLEWMPLEGIARFEPLSFQVPGLVPFAHSARVDLWCWHSAWPGPSLNPVVFCPRDLDAANVYAADFSGAVYRLLLEEFSGSWLVSDLGVAGTEERCRGYIDIVRSFFPESWVSTLREVVRSPFRELEPEVFGFIPRAEAESIAERDLACPELNREFAHYVPVA